jgi:Ca2+-binding RTX toxin-like protein
MIGGAGADQLIAGNGAQTFVYAAASEATGLGFDTITNFDTAVDTFDLPAAVTGIDAAITTGSLSTNGGAAYFDLFLQVAITTLAAHHAVLFTPDGGDAAGETFLIVDMNGTVGYQVAEDMVFLLDNASNLSSLGSTDFI